MVLVTKGRFARKILDRHKTRNKVWRKYTFFVASNSFRLNRFVRTGKSPDRSDCTYEKGGNAHFRLGNFVSVKCLFRSSHQLRKFFIIFEEEPQNRTMIKSREDIPLSSRIVIKAGTAVISNPDGYPSLTRMADLVEQCARLVHSGKEVILVSSGRFMVILLLVDGTG